MPYMETQVINHHAIQHSSNPLVVTSSDKNLQLYWRVAYISITGGGLIIKPGTTAGGSRRGPRRYRDTISPAVLLRSEVVEVRPHRANHCSKATFLYFHTHPKALPPGDRLFIHRPYGRLNISKSTGGRQGNCQHANPILAQEETKHQQIIK